MTWHVVFGPISASEHFDRCQIKTCQHSHIVFPPYSSETISFQTNSFVIVQKEEISPLSQMPLVKWIWLTQIAEDKVSDHKFPAWRTWQIWLTSEAERTVVFAQRGLLWRKLRLSGLLTASQTPLSPNLQPWMCTIVKTFFLCLLVICNSCLFELISALLQRQLMFMIVIAAYSNSSSSKASSPLTLK